MLFVIRDIRRLDAFTYTIGLAGLILLLLPVVPGIGDRDNGARLWVRVGPLAFQPAEFGRILIVIFLASYLAQKRELLAAGRRPVGLPRVKDLGPLLLAWGASLVVLFLERDMGASLLLFGVFVVMVWVATGRPATCHRGRAVRGRRVRRVPRVLARPGARRRVAARARARAGRGAGYQLAQGWFAFATGGHGRHRASAWGRRR